jgi:hypothetical protein
MSDGRIYYRVKPKSPVMDVIREALAKQKVFAEAVDRLKSSIRAARCGPGITPRL